MHPCPQPQQDATPDTKQVLRQWLWGESTDKGHTLGFVNNCFFKMLLQKNDDDPAAEKQKVRPEKVLGRARLWELRWRGWGEGRAGPR